MLETVRSRRRFGAAVVVLLPICVAGGYYLRLQRDEDLIQTASNLVAAPSPTPLPASSKPIPLTPAQHIALLRESAAVQERLEMLDRKEVQLEKDISELQVKLDRAREKRRAAGASTEGGAAQVAAVSR
ncbi:hypothetical protein JCM10908_007350 [Rhodotorula pacifica]|uniref:uncharacterized protein n=1 Tax=Rhodotorula pacifica TaxID=1495444 RepID=UPI00317587A2